MTPRPAATALCGIRTYADFAAFYGFTPWVYWPYRPQTKGKVKSGVKYVQRNALAGKRFRSLPLVGAAECLAPRVGDDRSRHARARERERFDPAAKKDVSYADFLQ